MNPLFSQAVRQNSTEEAHLLLRQVGILALQKRAGSLPDETKARLPDEMIFDWKAIINPVFWNWYPQTQVVEEIAEELRNGATYNWGEHHEFEISYNPRDKELIYSVYRYPDDYGNCRQRAWSERIDERNLMYVALWLGYNLAVWIPF